MNYYYSSATFSPKNMVFNTLSLFIIYSFTACSWQETKMPIPAAKKLALIKVHTPQINQSQQTTTTSKKKKIYLTFDDGPNNGTSNVINIIQEEQVPVTFFLVGAHSEGSVAQKELMEQLKNVRSSVLCNHSYSHAGNQYEKFYSHPELVVNDFKKAQLVMNLTNNIARCPGRNAWRIDSSITITDIKKSKQAIDSIHKNGFTVMGWDVEWHFDHQKMRTIQSPEKMVAEIDSIIQKKKTRYDDNVILLAHDQSFQKPEDSLALHKFIKLLKSRNEYELDIVTNYPLVINKEFIPDTTHIRRP
ncbi:MAG: polysaccharide deacetylase family protein [Niabella sp.]